MWQGKTNGTGKANRDSASMSWVSILLHLQNTASAVCHTHILKENTRFRHESCGKSTYTFSLDFPKQAVVTIRAKYHDSQKKSRFSELFLAFSFEALGTSLIFSIAQTTANAPGVPDPPADFRSQLLPLAPHPPPPSRPPKPHPQKRSIASLSIVVAYSHTHVQKTARSMIIPNSRGACEGISAKHMPREFHNYAPGIP